MTDHKTARGPALFHCAHDANEAAANERVNRYNAERFSRIVARPYRVEIPPCLIFEGKGCT